MNKNITLCMNNEIFGKILNTHDTNQSIKLFLDLLIVPFIGWV